MLTVSCQALRMFVNSPLAGFLGYLHLFILLHFLEYSALSYPGSLSSHVSVFALLSILMKFDGFVPSLLLLVLRETYFQNLGIPALWTRFFCVGWIFFSQGEEGTGNFGKLSSFFVFPLLLLLFFQCMTFDTNTGDLYMFFGLSVPGKNNFLFICFRFFLFCFED